MSVIERRFYYKSRVLSFRNLSGIFTSFFKAFTDLDGSFLSFFPWKSRSLLERHLHSIFFFCLLLTTHPKAYFPLDEMFARREIFILMGCAIKLLCNNKPLFRAAFSLLVVRIVPTNFEAKKPPNNETSRI